MNLPTTYVRYVILFSAVVILAAVVAVVTMRNRNEFRQTREIEQYPMNLTALQEPRGYQSWSWGISPDSVQWRIASDEPVNLPEYRERFPTMVTTRKSGNKRYNLDFTPHRCRSDYGFTFHAVHLIFHARNGLSGWDRIIDNRIIPDPGRSLEDSYEAIRDSITAKYPEAIPLEHKQWTKHTWRIQGLLWKGPTVFMTLELLEVNGGYRRIVQAAKRYR